MAAINKKKSDKSTRVVLTIFIIIVIVSLLLSFFITSYNNKNTVGILELPEVEFSIDTEDNDKPHTFKIKFSLEGNLRALRSLDQNKLLQVIRDTLNNGDYNKMIESEGTDYIKQLVSDELSRQFDFMEDKDFDFRGVYIVNIMNDYYRPLNEEKGSEKSTGRTGKDVANMFKK